MVDKRRQLDLPKGLYQLSPSTAKGIKEKIVVDYTLVFTHLSSLLQGPTMALNAYGIASSVFLALYAVLFIYLVINYATRRFTFKSRWSVLLFHVTIRLAAQGVGIGFAVQGFKATGLLVAALVLSAEGYFSLMLCTLRIFVSWQRHFTPERHSWLAGPKIPPQLSTARRVIEGLSLIGILRSPINAFHWLLIVANVLIITGGSLLSGGTTDTRDNWYVNNDEIHTSRALRGTGQAIFLCCTLFIFACIYHALVKASRADASADERKNRAILLVIACALPFMLCRGVFGLLQAVVDSLNYYNPSIYNDTGFDDKFVIEEVCCATMCEWCTAALLLSTSLLKGGVKSKGAAATAASSHDVSDVVSEKDEETRKSPPQESV